MRGWVLIYYIVDQNVAASNFPIFFAFNTNQSSAGGKKKQKQICFPAAGAFAKGMRIQWALSVSLVMRGACTEDSPAQMNTCAYCVVVIIQLHIII